MKRLNLGCGTDIRENWINLDHVPLPGVDIVHDLNEVPYPFSSGELDYILCKDVIEHLNDPAQTLKELHRILNNGGRLRITVPHFTSADSYADPTHKNCFSSKTFLFFLGDHSRSYYFDFSFREVKVKITFLKKLYLPWNYLLEPLININDQTRLIYEYSPLRLFPAFNIEVELTR